MVFNFVFNEEELKEACLFHFAPETNYMNDDFLIHSKSYLIFNYSVYPQFCHFLQSISKAKPVTLSFQKFFPNSQHHKK